MLDGAQGIGKSTLFKELVGEEYFSDSLQLSDMDGKAAAEKLQGHWVCEIAELAGLKKADQEKIKGFLSSSADKYRPAYGRVVESHPRHGILIATVNGEGGYLRDITGGRRFWVVKLHQTKQVKRFDFDEATRDQIWAEAKHLYQEGEELFLKGDLVEEATAAQRDALEEDERQGQVVLLFLVYFGMAKTFNLQLSGEAAAVIVFTFWGAGEMGDLVRGAITSIPVHQRESSAALGLTRGQTWRYVLLPQAARRLIPQAINLTTRMIKTTSLVMLIGVVEVLKVGSQIIDAARYDAPQGAVWVYGAVFFLYFFACWPISLAAGWLEKRWS